MPYVSVGKENSGDIEIYYEDHGSGDPVVLIHGWPFSRRAWEKQIPALVGEGYRVISYDRRGFGRSSQPAFGYDYDTFADDLNRLMESLDLKGATLMGHSMGSGEVARYLGKYGSSRVSQAVAIATLGPFLLKTRDNPGGLEQAVFDGIENSFATDRLASLTSFIKNFFNTDVTLGRLVSEEVIRAHWNIASMASPIGTLACIKAWGTDFRKDLAKIDVPLLIIHGDADRILPYEKTAPLEQQAVKGSRLVTIKNGSHGIFWTHAEELNREILRFLKTAGERKAA
ncbi:MAG: alpha/beta hydrolase [Oligoflexia bacterium]|nr:alpha/beta hydrolase [Oligoflexia bacterium]